MNGGPRTPDARRRRDFALDPPSLDPPTYGCCFGCPVLLFDAW